MPSNMGIGNARSLAHFHSLIAERKAFSEAFYKHFEQPLLVNNFDCVIGYEESKGCGFQFTTNSKVSIYHFRERSKPSLRSPLNNGFQGQWIFGHSGFGGQNVRVDIHNGLSYAYMCNGLKISDADHVEPWRRLVDKLYSLV